LLTGDGELRALAKAENVTFFGVLWVIDQLFDGTVMEAKAIVAGLESIAGHPRCRLPSGEIQARLERYKKPRERDARLSGACGQRLGDVA
jgi:hypothetical protein